VRDKKFAVENENSCSPQDKSIVSKRNCIDPSRTRRNEETAPGESKKKVNISSAVKP
jgi:hypothetical protein